MLLLLSLLPTLAFADDLEAAAKARMKLSVDYESLDSMLAPPAPAAPYAAAQVGVILPALPLEPNSTVQQVTVFTSGARVTRARTVELKPGATSIRFEGLPLNIEAGSLQADLQGGQAAVTGVERISSQAKAPDDEAGKALRDEAKALAEQLGTVQDRIAALLAQREYLRATLMRGGATQPVPALATVKGNLDFVSSAESEIAAKLRAEEDKARALDEKLSPLLTKIQNAEATGATVRVDLDVGKAGPVTVALTYQLQGAGWTPAYNARLSEDGSKVTFDYYGIVAQYTGEVWADTPLILSTANPPVSGDLPKLEPWYLGRGGYGSYGGGDFAGNLAASTGYVNDAPMAQQSMNAPPMAQMASLATAQRAGGAVVFAIPGKRTLSGDGSEQRLPIGSASFPVTLEYASTPRLIPNVYRRGRLIYAGDAPLLPGALSTFVGADFVGTDQIETTTPGEELVLSFGADDRFKVERTLVSREVDHPGAGRKTVRYTFHFRIEVTNYGKEAATVQITDQIPISEVDRVSVKLLETTAALPASPEDPAGVLKWRVDLAPGKESTIDLRFSVTGPADEGSGGYYRDLEMMY